MKHPARRLAATLSALLVTGLVAVPPADAGEALGTPGARGIGDSYFPKDGNGGYDVEHYDIHDTYRLRSGLLTGWTDVTARATQDLSSLSLDLVLTPDAVSVDGRPVAFAKAGRHELTVTPVATIPTGTEFVVRVKYHGTRAGRLGRRAAVLRRARRGRRDERAARRAVVVPVQRPPAGQGATTTSPSVSRAATR